VSGPKDAPTLVLLHGFPSSSRTLGTSHLDRLVNWGRNDPSFIAPGAEAFKRDLPNAEIHLLDAGHFALDEKNDEIARLVLTFLARHSH
jgi:pimeloyl-ACP methyl ester carboxylesterase